MPCEDCHTEYLAGAAEFADFLIQLDPDQDRHYLLALVGFLATRKDNTPCPTPSTNSEPPSTPSNTTEPTSPAPTSPKPNTSKPSTSS